MGAIGQRSETIKDKSGHLLLEKVLCIQLEHLAQFGDFHRGHFDIAQLGLLHPGDQNGAVSFCAQGAAQAFKMLGQSCCRSGGFMHGIIHQRESVPFPPQKKGFSSGRA